MMLGYEKNFESVAETYGGFPLKKDFLSAGNAALEKYGVKAKLEDNLIRIPFADRECYTADELEEMFPSDEDAPAEKPEDWRVRLDACIQLSKDPSEGVKDAWYEYDLINPYDADDEEFCCEKEEFDLAITLIETFLNAAVDCG